MSEEKQLYKCYRCKNPCNTIYRDHKKHGLCEKCYMEINNMNEEDYED